jgi:hypothetical protein
MKVIRSSSSRSYTGRQESNISVVSALVGSEARSTATTLGIHWLNSLSFERRAQVS